MENSKISLILASASPRRKELFGYLGIPFQIKALNVLEESLEKDPIKFSSEIAKLKGEAAVEELKRLKLPSPLYVVSADTIVCLSDKIYGKPQNRDEAYNFLMELSGKTHSVFTSVYGQLLINGESRTLNFTEESKVTFNNINSILMDNYLATGDSLDKAGAYGIQGPSLTFISKVEGDYANVVGFPLSRFIQETQTFFESLLKDRGSWQKLF
jgi:septum formation protein